MAKVRFKRFQGVGLRRGAMGFWVLYAKRLVRAVAGPVMMLLFAAGCQVFRDVADFRDALAAHFELNSVIVSHASTSNGPSLTITISAARIAGLEEGDVAAFAREIGSFARAHYRRFEEVTAVVVAFTEVQRGGAIAVTQARGSFRFLPSDLSSQDSSAAPPPRRDGGPFDGR